MSSEPHDPYVGINLDDLPLVKALMAADDRAKARRQAWPVLEALRDAVRSLLRLLDHECLERPNGDRLVDDPELLQSFLERIEWCLAVLPAEQIGKRALQLLGAVLNWGRPEEPAGEHPTIVPVGMVSNVRAACELLRAELEKFPTSGSARANAAGETGGQRPTVQLRPLRKPKRRGRPRKTKASKFDCTIATIAKRVTGDDSRREWKGLLAEFRDQLPKTMTPDALRKRVTRYLQRKHPDKN